MNFRKLYNQKRNNLNSKTHGAAAIHTQITWASFSGSQESSLKLLCSAKLLHTNSSPISNSRHSKLAIFFGDINPHINSLWQLHIGRHYIIYIYIYIYMYPDAWVFSIKYKSADRSTFAMYWGTFVMYPSFGSGTN